MAVCTPVAALASTLNQSVYTSATFTPPAGELLVAFVHASTTALANPTLTNNVTGQTFTLAKSYLNFDGTNSVYCYVANSLSTSTPTQQLSFNCTGDAATGCIIQICRVSGVTLTGSLAVRQSLAVIDVTPTASFPAACLTGNPTLAVVATQVNPPALTPPAGWTERSDIGYATPTTGSEYVTRDSGFTGTTMTWSPPVGIFCAVLAVELDTSAGGSAGATATTETMSVATAGFSSRFGAVAILETGLLSTLNGKVDARTTTDSSFAVGVSTAGIVSSAPPPNAWFGVTSVTATVTIFTPGVATGFDSSATDLTDAVTTIGRLGARSSSASAWTVGTVTRGTTANLKKGTYPSAFTWPGTQLWPGEWVTAQLNADVTAVFTDAITTAAALGALGATVTPATVQITTSGIVNNTSVLGLVSAAFVAPITTAGTRSTISSTDISETVTITTGANATTSFGATTETFTVAISTTGIGPQSILGAATANLVFNIATAGGEQGALGLATNRSLVMALSLLSLLPNYDQSVLAGADLAIQATPTSHQEFTRALSYLGLGEPDWRLIPASFAITVSTPQALVTSKPFLQALALLGYQTHVK